MKSLLPTRNDLPRTTRAKITDLLNQTLADLADLASQLRQAHWNVRGRHFYSLHKLFDDLTGTIEEELDPTAERITALGGLAHGSVRRAAAATSLPELPLQTEDDLGFVTALADRFALVGRQVRAAIEVADRLGDADTADLLTGLSRELDKGLWLLEAHLRT